MFLGQHDHSLDAKGRVILPAEYRDPFERGAVLTKLIDGCLALWTPEEFKRVADDLIEKARRGNAERTVARSFAGGAKSLDIDKQGRIAIPQHLRDYAGLDKEVVVTGQFNRVEIWNKERWQAVDASGEESLRGAAATESMSDLGI